jgi:hypothetical protein
MRSRIVFLLLLFESGLRAQGLVFNDDAYQGVAMKIEQNTGARGEEGTPKNIYKVDLKPYCPTVRQQGKISSCVGWSVGYSAMTIEKAVANGWGGDQATIDDHAFSAMFLYNQIKLGDCFFGAELNQAFGTLQEKGNVFYRDFAVGNNCDTLPASGLIDKARANRVKEFATLFKPDDSDDMKIGRVKRTLAQMKPVVIGMIILENFLTLKSKDQIWYPNVGKTDVFGGHAMVVIGYDDGLKAFEIMNSWGDGWANGGFVWIRYEDFARYCKYAYELVLENVHAESDILEGSVQVLKPVLKYAADGEIIAEFSPLSFSRTDKRFVLAQDQTSLPLEFQVVAEGLRKGSYLYVISFDGAFKPTIHWPRNEKLNRQFVGEQESALITSPYAKVILPGKYNVFTLSTAGTEYLHIINSLSPVMDLSERLRRISSGKGEFSDRVKKVFGTTPGADHSVSETDRINFYARGPKSEAISILLEFDMRK